MTMVTELEELLATVEEVRAERHPDVDSQFLQRVLEAEYRAGEDGNSALTEIRLAVADLAAVIAAEPSNA